jgi:hypothetical protein
VFPRSSLHHRPPPRSSLLVGLHPSRAGCFAAVQFLRSPFVVARSSPRTVPPGSQVMPARTPSIEHRPSAAESRRPSAPPGMIRGHRDAVRFRGGPPIRAGCGESIRRASACAVAPLEPRVHVRRRWRGRAAPSASRSATARVSRARREAVISLRGDVRRGEDALHRDAVLVLCRAQRPPAGQRWIRLPPRPRDRREVSRETSTIAEPTPIALIACRPVGQCRLGDTDVQPRGRSGTLRYPDQTSFLGHGRRGSHDLLS